MSNSLVGALGAKYPDSKVLFADDFRDGLNGWGALMDSTTPRPAPTLSSVNALNGPHALKICTGSVAQSAKDGIAVAIKRMTRTHDTGVVNFDLSWAWGGEEAPSAPQCYDFRIDTQKRDGSERTYFAARWANINWPVDGTTVTKWEIKDDDGNWVDVPDAVYQLPYNENKLNFIYTRLSVDLANGYQELQVYDDVYDLSGLGAGSGKESTVNNFNGGLNFDVYVWNRTSDFGQAWMLVDSARGWYS